MRSATPVTRRVIEAAENLKIIGRAGVGVDTIDLDAATERGVIVCNAPTSNIMSAAEHTMALMLACARQLPQANASMHEGKWERSKFLGKELYEKTLAIFGLGRIGGLVAERARAFGMKIIGTTRIAAPSAPTSWVLSFSSAWKTCSRAPTSSPCICRRRPRPSACSVPKNSRHEGRRRADQRGAAGGPPTT